MSLPSNVTTRRAKIKAEATLIVGAVMNRKIQAFDDSELLILMTERVI